MRVLIAIIIATVPTNVARLFLYRNLLGYKISDGAKIGPLNVINSHRCDLGKVRIGFCNWIDVRNLTLSDDVYIGRLNRFKWLYLFDVDSNSSFVAGNVVIGTRPGMSPFKNNEMIRIGKSCVITSRHIFDVTDQIEMGDDVTIAGTGTQIWSHGFDLGHVRMQAGIKVGSRVYIGSRSILLPGVVIADDVMIGAGTTVSRSISTGGLYVSSQLARKGPIPSYADNDSVVEYKGYKFVRAEPHKSKMKKC